LCTIEKKGVGILNLPNFLEPTRRPWKSENKKDTYTPQSRRKGPKENPTQDCFEKASKWGREGRGGRKGGREEGRKGGTGKRSERRRRDWQGWRMKV